MPGAYAHITLVNQLSASTQLDTIPGFPKEAKVFAVALLVGYSVDLLFAFMDRILAAFTTPK
jgi:hypothetical protein